MFSMQTDLHISTVQRVDNITQCVLVLIAQMPTEIYVIGIFNRFTMGLWPFVYFTASAPTTRRPIEGMFKAQTARLNSNHYPVSSIG